MAANIFDPKILNWNIHTKGIWVSKKEIFTERFQKMNFEKSVNNGWNVPAQVGAELNRFIDALPSNPVILEIAYDLDKPKDILYGLKVHYANCDVIQYLHSNGYRISVVAVHQIPHLEVVK